MTSAPARTVCMVVYTNYVIDARVRREAETLAAYGFRVICLTNRMGAEPRWYVLDGVEVRELAVPKYRGKSLVAYIASYVHFFVAASVACARLQWSGRLDAVHAHNVPDFLVFAGLLPRLRGAKVILDVHDSIPETYASKFANGALRWRLLCLEERLSMLVAHRVICVNHPQREALVARRLPPAKAFVSMNVPDPRIFGTPGEARTARHDEPGRPLRLVYHGTMAARLGVDLVIRAVHALRDRIPDLELHLWGSGDDLDAFRAAAAQLDVARQVHFRPEGYPLSELPERLAAMDMGVVGNRRTVAGELMLPVKLLEYVALGIPVVAPRLKTITHYFTDEMVSFYEPDDADAMADAIYRLHAQPHLRAEQARRARTFLAENGWNRQGPELVSFYEQLLEN